ncbi:MAG: hypothetical protein ACR2HO_13210 [Rubrobacteraceae bacterium]|nr:hypothetical protein [Rubrobacter sp.]
MRKLGERLEETEEEWDQTNAAANDLYEYFREHMREVPRDGSNEELPVKTLGAGHPDRLDKRDVDREEG